MPTMGKILAIDYGTKNLGLAVSDSGRKMAIGRGIFDRKLGFEKLVKHIGKLCADENVTEILLGLPLGNEGEETVQTRRIRNFAEKLGLYVTGVKMSFIDESFTSFEARQFLDQIGVKTHLHRQSEDEVAALLILNRYLEAQKGS